jgi:hypothetical protein
MKILSASLLSVLCLAFTVPSFAAEYCGRYGFNSLANTATLGDKLQGPSGAIRYIDVNLESDIIQALNINQGACVCLDGELKTTKGSESPYLDPNLARLIPEQNCQDYGL